MLAFITGSGFYDIPGLEDRSVRVIDTPYGSVSVSSGSLDGREIMFIPRHGADHSLPPHAINYRANVWALRDAGADGIVAINVVGSIDPAHGAGSFLLCDQFLEFTSGRDVTFFDEPGNVQHIDMTEPYDLALRAQLSEAAAALGIDLAPTATYVCVNGPRFETPAEIKMYDILGGTVVGMTGYPEVALARELGVPYAAVAIVANLAAGLQGEELSHHDVVEVIEGTKQPMFALLTKLASMA